MSSILNQFREFPPFVKLLFLLMLIIAGMLIATFAGFLLALPFYGSEAFVILSGGQDLTNPTHLSLLRYFQIISHFGMFIIPAIVYAKLFEAGNRSFFAFRNRISVFILFIGGFVMVLMLPFVNYLGDLNSYIHFPQSMKGLEDVLRTLEETAEETILALVSDSRWQIYLLNMFMIAVVPSIGEELIFRGVLQRKLMQWFGNVHLAILVSAVIFSAVHLQFFGFLPRVFLGVLLGYMFVWTGSLWLPMFAHFINNGLAVTVAWLHASGNISQDLETFGNFSGQTGQMIMLSAMAFFALLILWYVNKKTNPRYCSLQ
jgi:uncharacterized protein